MKYDAAKSFVVEALRHGPIASKQLEADAKNAGISVSTLRRSIDALDVIAEVPDFGGGWQYRFEKDANGQCVEWRAVIALARYAACACRPSHSG
ncbi:MAG TPA: hypothetical protein VGB55_13635 [Tepidisphaeraceae bacterium]